ncbi:hypothetical protein PAXINDRAFT_93587 [Paxillus involutus ATCC 200175]|uniref:T6SS Phospholipase effector Tle1-like catalytic domain-containing protein n=1 Tax=Paxillus involutus ATCC 200175 TaxID=664439 RepID=A0A0C9SM09_PAXIN|nr:hypothetical protein PAXINDRAFT_93587 [Paxillus involutus ATCC 200175]
MPSIVPSTVLNGDAVGSPVEGPSPTRCTKCTAQQRPYPPSVKRRNLVVCIDGTSNKFGQNNTNVVKLFSKIKFDSEAPLPRQLAYYSSGVGTGPKPWHVVSRIQRSLSDLLDEAVAWNVAEIVQDAYGWLAREYREGDQIYLFGFSRGAYQVRILAAVIYEVGLIKTVTDKQIGMAYEHYMTVRLQKLHAKDMASAFKRTFCWKDMKVHFVGVWDTVSSVGLVKEDASLSSSSSADHACHFRHALALDERRVKFLPEYFREMNTVTDDKKAASAQKQKSKYIDEKGASDKQASQLKGAFGNSTASKASNIKEVWFAGSHSDVYVYVPSLRDCVLTSPYLKWWKKRTWTVFACGQRFAHVDAPGGL